MIEKIALDGNKAKNEMIDRGAFDDGSIRLDECNRVTLRDVTVRDFYCDGIVWGIAGGAVAVFAVVQLARPTPQRSTL